MLPEVLAIFLSGAQASAGAYPVFGQANFTCQKWTADKENSGFRLAQVAYISGYITAINMVSHSNQSNEIDPKAALELVDTACSRMPKYKVSQVLEMLSAQILSKAILKGVVPVWGLDGYKFK
jgi:hypothetical protein